jgi:hypothetical protein
MQLIQSKSILAKLMATENLIVEERKCSTASFDVQNRILTIPILDKSLTSEVYDLFTGHEVGHALYTPLEGMKKVIAEKIVNKTVLNVVEDARIERKIQSKYPGLKSSFLKAYTELLDRDFFGTAGKDLNDLNFIDRVNMHFKGGPGLLIKFSFEEKVLVDEIQNTETYDDVVEVSKRVQKFMKEQALKDRAKEHGIDSENLEEDDLEDMLNEIITQLEESDEYDEQEVQEIAEELENSLNDDISAKTDEEFEKNSSRLHDSKTREIAYANIPVMDTKKAIVDFKQLYQTYIKDGGTLDIAGFQKLRKESEKIVSYLVKEFEMRKNASQLKRASVAKTGELNMSKIYSYGFSEDLFKRITVMPDGKSHGLVMFIDWSGSMTSHLKNTVKQLFNLVLFCRKVNIPYEVYAFSDGTNSVISPEINPYKPVLEDGDLFICEFRLLNLFSSRMGPTDFHTACSAISAYCNFSNLSYEDRKIPHWFHLNSTPLNESIIAAMSIVPAFRDKYKLQKVNTVFLTDGESNSIPGIASSNGRTYTHYSPYAPLVIRDKKTKEQVFLAQALNEKVTSALVSLFRKITDTNAIGYYLLTGKEFKSRAHKFFELTSEALLAQDEFRKQKFAVVKSAGYDEYYLLKSEPNHIQPRWNQTNNDEFEEESFEVAENATRRGIVSAFAKHNANKMSNRVILNRFINLIS